MEQRYAEYLGFPVEYNPTAATDSRRQCFHRIRSNFRQHGMDKRPRWSAYRPIQQDANPRLFRPG